MTDDRGFTLVEMALVLIVVGLLIGGVMMGLILHKNTQIQYSYTLAKKVQLATSEFIATYNALPGDLGDSDNATNNAVTRLTHPAGCHDGDYNGIVGTVLADITAAAPLNGEEAEFWQHLACANLLTGLVEDGQATANVWGTSHPISPLEGGFHIVTLAGGGVTEPDPGLFLRWQYNINGVPRPVLTPAAAVYLDRKYDDGQQNTGFIRAAGTAVCDYDASDGTTNENNDQTLECYLYFRLRENAAL